ncbi:lysylphosphatidylglycerol synthase domain-containing protein [Catenulispora yoronensis]|uniref:Lysylphosphatidylglycerol synthase domain-containing protein n=1 Tax=Catenulispora yoronensis TaxID=450799 RepID=A0ABN2TVB4_9ACTN
MSETQPGAAEVSDRARRWKPGRVVGLVAGVALLVAVFGFAFPALASYSSVINILRSMTKAGVAVVAIATLANLLANWFLITTALPGLTMRRAAATNLASTAVANTVPGGGAIAMGVSWRMLTGWGVTSRAFGVYAIATGVWSTIAKFATPAVALIILALSHDLPTASNQVALLWISASVGLGISIPMVALVRLALRDDHGAMAADRWLSRLSGRLFRALKRPTPDVLTGMMVRLRQEAGTLIATRGRRLTLAIIISDLGWWVVLQSSLWACGIKQSQVSWQMCFAGFAVARAVSSVPITPGGLGMIDYALTLFLLSGLDTPTAARVLAAIMLTRAMTLALPIPLGAVTYLGWQMMTRRRRVVA